MRLEVVMECACTCLEEFGNLGGAELPCGDAGITGEDFFEKVAGALAERVHGSRFREDSEALGLCEAV